MDREAEVKQLVLQVPAPPGEQLPSGTTEDAISAFRRRAGIDVPVALRNWLQHVNGPCIGPGGLLGIETGRPSLDIEMVLNWYPQWRERGWLPVASDGCGNYYVLNTVERSGPIYFVDTASDANHLSHVVGSNLWTFLWFLLGNEISKTGWPFSEEYVVLHDPEIVMCTAAPCPWQIDRSS